MKNKISKFWYGAWFLLVFNEFFNHELLLACRTWFSIKSIILIFWVSKYFFRRTILSSISNPINMNIVGLLFDEPFSFLIVEDSFGHYVIEELFQ